MHAQMKSKGALALPAAAIHQLRGHNGPVLKVHWTHNGQYALSCGQDKSIKLWNPHRGIFVNNYTVHGTNDNSRFVSVGGGNQVLLVDVTTGRVLRKFHGHRGVVNSVALNDEGSLFVTGGYDKRLLVWDLKSHSTQPIQEMAEARDTISSLILSDAEIISSSLDGCIRAYDFRAGLLRMDDLNNPVTSISVSLEGGVLLASCLCSAVRLIDKKNGGILRSYTGHVNESFRTDSCFSGTMAHVLSGSEDCMTYCWSFLEGKIVRKYPGHKDIVSSIEFHPEDCGLLTGSVDGTILVWSGLCSFKWELTP